MRLETGNQRSTFQPHRLAALASLGATVFFASLAAAQDTVYITGISGGRTKVQGKIVDYTGRELQIELSTGRRQTFPAARILSVDTDYTPKHHAANEAYAVGRAADAAPLYRQALDVEKRPWVRREITARLMHCYRAMGLIERAGEQFLTLVREDPDTTQFDNIPLAWLPRQPSPALEQAARQWLRRDEPLAALLGASHLLNSADSQAAAAKLNQLATGDDRRIAQLAAAQTWRLAIMRATAEQIAGWVTAAEAMPEGLQGGPYYVIGLARARIQHWEAATLCFLRVPILYPQDRQLAAQALIDAGRALEMMGQPADAARMYREVIDRYADNARAVAEAQGRLSEAK